MVFRQIRPIQCEIHILTSTTIVSSEEYNTNTTVLKKKNTLLYSIVITLTICFEEAFTNKFLKKMYWDGFARFRYLNISKALFDRKFY